MVKYMSTKNLPVSNSQGLKLQVCIYYTRFLLQGIMRSNLGPHPVRQTLYWLSYYLRPLFCTFWNKIKAHSMHIFVSDVVLCVCNITLMKVIYIYHTGYSPCCSIWLSNMWSSHSLFPLVGHLSHFYFGSLSLWRIFFCICTKEWNYIILWSVHAQ